VATLIRKFTYAEHRLNIESALAAEGHAGSSPATSSFMLVSLVHGHHLVKHEGRLKVKRTGK
jgi:hypothetical protein